MSYRTLNKEYKFNLSKLDLGRDLPDLIEIMETLIAQYQVDVRQGELASLDFISAHLSDMNDYVGDLMEEYERMLIRRERALELRDYGNQYEQHYG